MADERALAERLISFDTSRPDQIESAAAFVGTYSSGGNTYVMYADGSIDAQTPSGLYRFDSLEELKAFIAGGGESVTPPGGSGRG